MCEYGVRAGILFQQLRQRHQYVGLVPIGFSDTKLSVGLQLHEDVFYDAPGGHGYVDTKEAGLTVSMTYRPDLTASVPDQCLRQYWSEYEIKVLRPTLARVLLKPRIVGVEKHFAKIVTGAQELAPIDVDVVSTLEVKGLHLKPIRVHSWEKLVPVDSREGKVMKAFLTLMRGEYFKELYPDTTVPCSEDLEGLRKAFDDALEELHHPVPA